jgi:hypothetical protein
LEIDAKGKCEGVADPSARNGRRYIRPQEEGCQRRSDHLDRQRHERKKGSDCHSQGKFLTRGMPQFIRKKALSKNPMNPCATDMLSARQVAQVSANLAAPPLYGFHFLKSFSVVLMLASQDRF